MSGSKGFYFSIDAMFAIVLLLVASFVMPSFFVSEKPIADLHHESDDFMTALSELKVSETNNSYVKQLISQHKITNLNNTVLQQIGDFWAAGQLSYAANLTKAFSYNLLPSNQGFGLYINSQKIYEKQFSEISTIASAPKLFSGIMANRSSTGFIGRALIRSARKNTNTVVLGDVVSSSVRKPAAANNLNLVNVTYIVNLPGNLTIQKAYWFIESSWTDNHFKAWVNNQYIPGSPASGSKLLTDLESYFHGGRNTATALFEFGSGGYEGGDDGASHIVVNYTTDQMNTLMMNVTKKYLYDITSNCSIMYKKPIFVTGNLLSVNINLHVISKNVTLGYVVNGVAKNISRKNVTSNHVSWTDAEIKAAMQANGVNYSQLSNKYIWFTFEVDKYHQRELFGQGRRIFSDSYVDAKTDFNPKFEYSYVDITAIIPPYTYSIPDSGQFYRYAEWRYWAPNASVPLLLDSQLAWKYVVATNPNQLIRANQYTLYSHPPQPLIPELARFGYGGNYTLPNKTNKYMLNFTTGYSVNPINSLVSYTFLIKGAVPYGTTFDTRQEAVADALKRLNLTLGPYLKNTIVANETYAVGGVPYMWGPAIVEARAWQ
jgi:hypothetical protein